MSAMSILRSRALGIPVGVAFIGFLAHSWVFRAWIVDDAGISFAYAKHLAQGQGLVGQPGQPPVEGFTNLLWVLLIALSMSLRLFSAVVTPKVLSALSVAAAFLWMGRATWNHGERPSWLIGLALGVTAATPAFAIWCSSGLENGLYAMLVAAMVAAAMRPAFERPHMVVSGLLVFLAFCTRPDGILYFWIVPFLVGAEVARTGHDRRLGVYVLSFVVPCLLLTAWRAHYYHDVLPNTFYAKRAEGSIQMAWVMKRLPLPFIWAGTSVLTTACAVLVARVSFAVGRRFGPQRKGGRLSATTLALYFANALFVHQALPGDWMGEYRFATPAFLLGPSTILVVLWELWGARVGRVLGIAAIASAALIVAVVYAVPRSAAFAASPTISFEGVRAVTTRIGLVTDRLPGRPAVLIPDVGGALWEDRFRVVDLAGLTDRSFPREMRHDPEPVRRQVLEVIRPEGIYLHSFWLRATGFEHDSVFRATYVPVWERRVDPESTLAEGFYLRRELVPKAVVLDSGDE